MKIKSGNTAKNALHKKESLLLVLVFTGVLIAVVYMMVYTPLQEERTELENQMQILDTELNAKLTQVGQLPSLQEQMRLAEQGGEELYNRFYGSVDQEEFIFMLHRCAKDSGIQLERVVFDAVKVPLGDEYTPQPEEEEQEDPDADSDAAAGDAAVDADDINERFEAVLAYFSTLKKTAISLDISGEYEQCIQFLNLLHINDKKIAVTDVLLESQEPEEEASESEAQPAELSQTEATTPMRGVISLVIYHVPEADTVHQERDGRKESGEEWIVGATDPFSAAVIAPKNTETPSQ